MTNNKSKGSKYFKNGTRIRLPLPSSGQGYCTNDDGVHYAYIKPTKEHNLNQIPKGVNPRQVNSKNTVSKKIKTTLEARDATFSAKNGGVQVLVDKGSVEVHDNFVSFVCSEKNTGHYDGQHTIHQVVKFVETNGDIGNNSVNLQLIETSLFGDDVDGVRATAEAVNDRTPQLATSEANIRGEFDEIKDSLTYTDQKNIGWEQYQLNENEEKIHPETRVEQVIKLIATVTPTSSIIGINDLTPLAKKAKTAILKFWRKNPELMKHAACHVDYVLEVSDYFQENSERIVGGKQSADSYGVFRKYRNFDKKPQMIHDREYWQAQLFKKGECRKGHLLNKDYMLPLVHAVVAHCFEYDLNNGFIKKYDLAEAKAIIEECGEALIYILERHFETKLASSNFRSSDLVNDTRLWQDLKFCVEECIEEYKWKNRITTIAAA
jgi:hypothetical protein